MNEVVLVIMTLCNLNVTNVIMPKTEKLLCIEELTNCLVGPNGVYMRDKREACENTYNNNKKNRSKND